MEKNLTCVFSKLSTTPQPCAVLKSHFRFRQLIVLVVRSRSYTTGQVLEQSKKLPETHKDITQTSSVDFSSTLKRIRQLCVYSSLSDHSMTLAPDIG